MTSKIGNGFRTKPDKSGRVRLVKVYGLGLSASRKIAMRKSTKKRVTKRMKAMQRP